MERLISDSWAYSCKDHCLLIPNSSFIFNSELAWTVPQVDRRNVMHRLDVLDLIAVEIPNPDLFLCYYHS